MNFVSFVGILTTFLFIIGFSSLIIDKDNSFGLPILFFSIATLIGLLLAGLFIR